MHCYETIKMPTTNTLMPEWDSCRPKVWVKQLKVSRDGQLLHHTVPWDASQRQFTSLVPILSPATDKLLFLNQPKLDKRMCRTQGLISSLLAYELDKLHTELPYPVIIGMFS